MASKIMTTPLSKNLKRFKGLFFGPPSVGKTTFALGFPKVHLFDCERGAENDQYIDLLEKRGSTRLLTTDFDDLLTQTRAYASEKHDRQTLVYDPITVPYNAMLDKYADEVGTDFGRHKIPADRKMRHLLNLCFRSDLNIIMIAHAKTNWVRSKDARGNDTITDAGKTFDAFNKSDYSFDFVGEAAKRGPDRILIVRKSRLDAFPEGSELPLSYDAFADKYGRHLIEREVVPVEFATAEQVDELSRLLDVRTDGETLKERWLKKAEAEDLTELPKDIADKCIVYLKEGKKE